MTLREGYIFHFHSSQQLPHLRLGPLKGFFELTQHPSRAIDKDIVRCDMLGADVP